MEKTIDPKEASTIEGYWLSSMGIIGGSVTISSYTTYSIFTRTDKIVYLKDLKNEGDKRVYKSIYDKKIRWGKIKNTVLGTFILVSILQIEEYFIDSDFMDVDHW